MAWQRLLLLSWPMVVLPSIVYNQMIGHMPYVMNILRWGCCEVTAAYYWTAYSALEAVFTAKVLRLTHFALQSYSRSIAGV